MDGYDATELYRSGRQRRGNGHWAKGLASGGRLTAADRHALPSKDFALPGERYPIEDNSHARNALARVSQHGSSTEKAAVRSKVHSKFPDIGAD